MTSGWAGLVGLWMASATVAAAVEQQKLIIHLFDYARLSGSALEETSMGAQRLLADAGVETEWRICSVPAMRGACALPGDSGAPIVRITAKSRRNMDRAFGAAIKPLDGGPGVYATVFYDRVASASRRVEVQATVLLSCAVAHELGELLGLEHAPAGIMHAFFDGADIARAARGRLRFSPAQALHLRDVVLTRMKRRGEPVQATR